MTIEEYLISKKKSFIDTFSEQLKSIEVEPDDDRALKMLTEVMNQADAHKAHYNEGFEACLDLLYEIDSKFLYRKLPPHVTKY